jgi:hypothetical protein
MADFEPLERQDELELLRAAFGDGTVMITEEKSGELHLKVMLSSPVISEDHVHLALPAAYPHPDAPLPRWSISSSQLSRTHEEQLSAQIRAFFEGNRGRSCCFDSIQFLRDSYDALLTCSDSNVDSSAVAPPPAAPLVLKQVVVWFHHIYSATKKKEIVDGAAELGLGGWWKANAPGVIVAEGPRDHVDAYVRRLARLQWQHMVVRGERLVEVADADALDAARAMPTAFVEVADMSELGQLCGAAGLRDLFMSIMKG